MNPVWVPSIPAGGSALVSPAWFPPDPIWYQGGITSQGHPMLCLLARVVSPQDPMFDEQEPQNPIAPNIKNNNNIVTRNTYITDLDPNDSTGKWVTALACSVSEVNSELNIHLSSISERESAPFREYGGRLTMQMDEEMWQGWMASGARGEGVEIIGKRLVSFTDPDQGAWFYGVQIGPDDCRTFAIQAEITPGGIIREQVNYAFMVEQYTNQVVVPDGAVVFEVRLNPAER